MNGKMKTYPGSRRIWNLIVGIFRGGHSQSSMKFFQQVLYSLASTVAGDCSRTSPGHCCMAALSSCSSVKFPNIYWLL